MNFRAAAMYTNRSKTEIKTELEPILEALEEIGCKQKLGIGLLDFWLHGTIPINYHIYLQELNAEQLLKDNGVPGEHISTILSGDTLDNYALFKNACLNFIGEELTVDFKTVVLDPINKLLIQPHEQDKKHKTKELERVRNIIKNLKSGIAKAISDIEKVEPHIIAGTFEESIFIKLKQIEHLVINQIEA